MSLLSTFVSACPLGKNMNIVVGLQKEINKALH